MPDRVRFLLRFPGFAAVPTVLPCHFLQRNTIVERHVQIEGKRLRRRSVQSFRRHDAFDGRSFYDLNIPCCRGQRRVQPVDVGYQFGHGGQFHEEHAGWIDLKGGFAVDHGLHRRDRCFESHGIGLRHDLGSQ